jgi:hypothetical protein
MPKTDKPGERVPASAEVEIVVPRGGRYWQRENRRARREVSANAEEWPKLRDRRSDQKQEPTV